MLLVFVHKLLKGWIILSFKNFSIIENVNCFYFCIMNDAVISILIYKYLIIFLITSFG